jgi:hypothetical protein
MSELVGARPEPRRLCRNEEYSGVRWSFGISSYWPLADPRIKPHPQMQIQQGSRLEMHQRELQLSPGAIFNRAWALLRLKSLDCADAGEFAAQRPVVGEVAIQLALPPGGGEALLKQRSTGRREAVEEDSGDGAHATSSTRRDMIATQWELILFYGLPGSDGIPFR